MTKRTFIECLGRTDALGTQFRGDLSRSLVCLAERCAGGRPVFWECDNFKNETLDQPFICEVLATPPSISSFLAEANGEAFNEHFSDACAGSSVAFPNLGGTATLVAPQQLADAGKQFAVANNFPAIS
jgi:hypothetical protein